MSVLVIGVGNRERGDDGLGPAAADLVRARAPSGVRVAVESGEPATLLAAWRGARAVIVIDASSGGGPAGSVLRYDVGRAPAPADRLRSSTHALGLADAVELARALGELPERTVVFAVEGKDFGLGAGLSPEAEGALAPLVARVLEEAEALRAEEVAARA